MSLLFIINDVTFKCCFHAQFSESQTFLFEKVKCYIKAAREFCYSETLVVTGKWLAKLWW